MVNLGAFNLVNSETGDEVAEMVDPDGTCIVCNEWEVMVTVARTL